MNKEIFKKLKKDFGINVKDKDGSYKTTYQVLNEIAQNWF